MPRPTRQRTSLPSHSRSAKLDARPAAPPAPDDLADSYMMSTEEMAPIAAVKAAAADESARSRTRDDTGEPQPPKGKQTKAEKAYNRHKVLLEKITAGASPYSKSHARRVRRAAQPANNLVASLAEVEAVLPQLSDEGVSGEEGGEDQEYEMEGGEELGQVQKPKTGGKGKEKLTAKKRQRVLTAESARLPAIIKNEAFATSPFATIRQHTLNTLLMQKNPPVQKAKARGAGTGSKAAK
ncbi:hypothetical protein JCM3770_005682 [Rhodotorula araucariae]